MENHTIPTSEIETYLATLIETSQDAILATKQMVRRSEKLNSEITVNRADA